MPDGLAVEEVMRIVKRCEPALTNEDSEHRCGVRGFAESGDDCLGCKRDAIIAADKRRRSTR
jgi:hypothetical protein